VILLASITIGPALYVLHASLENFTLLSSTPPAFVGLENYVYIATNPENRNSLLATVLFIVSTVTLEVLFGLALALALRRRTLGNTVATSLLILPFAVTPSVSALMWQLLLNPNYGWLDYYLGRIGLMPSPVAWLSSPVTAWIAIIALQVWIATPFAMLVLMAGLQGLPADVSEAARVDGANAWQHFINITLPLLRPALAITVVLSVVGASQVYTTVYVLTNGGPGASTRVVSLAIFQIGLSDFNIGVASAFCVIFLIGLLIVVPFMLRILTRNTDLATA
jgi:multiple sugar transport system permease protein